MAKVYITNSSSEETSNTQVRYVCKTLKANHAKEPALFLRFLDRLCFVGYSMQFYTAKRSVDNMEDKGMEKVRTQNFQKVITDISNNQKKPYQIIFTTSMINDDLNNTSLCVGREYTSADKSLRMQSTS